jgi:hypothetical protein
MSLHIPSLRDFSRIRYKTSIFRWYWLGFSLSLLILADIYTTSYLVSQPGIYETNLFPRLMLDESLFLWPVCSLFCLVSVLVLTASLFRARDITYYIPPWVSLVPCIVIESIAVWCNYSLMLTL